MTPLGMLFIIAFLAGSAWALGSLVRRLRRERAGTRWWLAFFILIAVGVSGGVWCALHCEYPLGADFRVGSFPMPVVFFHREDGQWVDFPVPAFQAWSAVFTNIVTITALVTVPLWLVSWRQHRHEQTPAQPAAPANAG